MSDTKTDTSNPELLVKEKLDELISFRNSTESMHEFWAKQYDLGLAWVQFPTGSGGLDLNPNFQLMINQNKTDTPVLASEGFFPYPDNIELSLIHN